MWLRLMGIGLLLFFCRGAWGQEHRILLQPDMVINESGFGKAKLLVDEQKQIGDPFAIPAKTPKTAWTAGWDAWKYPIRAIIDLGDKFRIRRVFLYDGEGKGDVAIETGTPKEWQNLLVDPMERFQEWSDHKVDVVTRYLRITIVSPGFEMPELFLYGAPVNGARLGRPAAGASYTRPTIDQLIGINAFIDDPLEKMLVGGFVREYHTSVWDEEDSPAYKGYPNNLYRWNPSGGANGAWNFDAYYTKLKNAGITVSPVLQQSPFWLTGREKDAREKKPLRPDREAGNPFSYMEHADYLFQFAARYGKIAVDPALLKLAPNQPKQTGLGLLNYVENWNEPDKTWLGREAYFSPFELAAMCSADYDGHLGMLGNNLGIKNADPTMKLVMGGLAYWNLEYLRAMVFWGEIFRKGSFPVDVINLHHYCNSGGEQGQLKEGICPEEDGLKERLKEIMAFREEFLPGIEIWVTEFGYDSNPKSPQSLKPPAGMEREAVRGAWILRTYLLLAQAGVDRAALYMLRDVNAQDGTQFASSGLTGSKEQKWNLKPAWYYVVTLKHHLTGLRFAEESPTGNPSVWCYRFQSENGKRVAYALWSPTAEGKLVAGYALKLKSKAQSVKHIQFADKQPKGVVKPLPVVGGAVKVDVGETPILILVDK